MRYGTRMFIFRKIVELVLTLFIVTIISFILMRVSPVDPAEAYARRNSFAMSEETINSLREEMGLNKPLLVQYIEWLKDATHLEFGNSYVNGRNVFSEVTNAFKVTGAIVIITAIIQAIGSLIVGCVCYYFKNILGKIMGVLCIAAISIPSFFFAGLFIDIFAVKFGWMNVAGNTGFLRYFPAALCLGISGIAFFGQMLANGIKNEMDEDCVFYARCRGLSEQRIMLFHALPQAVTGLLPNFMQMMGLCLAGSMVVERVFSLPGLGYLIIEGVLYRDSPIIHATILYLALSLVTFNIIADVLQRILQKGVVKEK